MSICLRRSAALAQLALVVAGCQAATSELLPPTTLEILSAPRGLGVPGWELMDTLIVRSVDESGRPRANQLLGWVVRAGGGSIRAIDSLTDSAGIGRAIWRLGRFAGINQAEVRTADDSVGWQVQGTAFRADKVDSDYGEMCALRGGDLWCLGSGQAPAPYSRGPDRVGLGTTFPGPSRVTSGRGYIDLALGGQGVVCGITAAGVVECLSYWSTEMPVPVSGLPPVRQLHTAGFRRYCALALSDSTAWCWRSSNAPAQVTGSPAFIALAADAEVGNRICGLRGDSTAACWGGPPVGDGTMVGRDSPTAVAGGMTFVRIAAGDGFACGLRSNNEVWCWGLNSQRSLGVDGPDALSPVLSAQAVSDLSIQGLIVAVLKGRSVFRWGDLALLAQGSLLTPLEGFDDQLVAGFANNGNSCLLLADNQVYCYHEMWVFSSTVDIHLFLAVQPVAEQVSE